MHTLAKRVYSVNLKIIVKEELDQLQLLKLSSRIFGLFLRDASSSQSSPLSRVQTPEPLYLSARASLRLECRTLHPFTLETVSSSGGGEMVDKKEMG